MRIVCYKGKGKGRQPWRWRLVARNGKIVADSAEGYATRSNLCEGGCVWAPQHLCSRCV